MTSVSFDDVLLVPQYSDIESRRDLSTENKLGDIELRLPIISSPMDTVTEDLMAYCMGYSEGPGGLGIIHRYNTPEEQAKMVMQTRVRGYPAGWHCPNIGAAIGVTGDYLERAQAVVDAGANVLCVDVAHGHHSMMKNANTHAGLLVMMQVFMCLDRHATVLSMLTLWSMLTSQNLGSCLLTASDCFLICG